MTITSISELFFPSLPYQEERAPDQASARKVSEKTTAPTQNFQANWDATNEHLKPAQTATIKQIAWNIFSVLIPIVGFARLIGYAIGGLANAMILPATGMPSHKSKHLFNIFWKEPLIRESQILREKFTAEEHTIITPDAAQLSLKLLRHKEANESTPTIIHFNANSQFALGVPHPLLADQSIELGEPCHLVFFDYRGVADSTGTFKSTNDLIVDGSSVVQWVRKTLHTPNDQIHFYGRSLGGAIAAHTQALDPTLTGKHVNERSFSSTAKMSETILGSRLGNFLDGIVKSQGYDLDPATAFNKIKGKKLVLYHPKDQTIPYSASLASAVNPIQISNLLDNTITQRETCSLRLDSKEPAKRQDPHNTPLGSFEREANFVGRFLFKKS